MFSRFKYLIASLAIASVAVAQGGNPRGTPSTLLNGKKVSIEHGSPALKGRAFADLSAKLPADRIWRAGENQVTTLTTEADLTIGGKKVPAGKYSVYIHVAESGSWSLILNSDLGVPLGKIWDKAPDNMKNEPWPYLQGYTQSVGGKEVARVPMTKAASTASADTFKLAFEGGKLIATWGDQAWSVDIAAAKAS